MIIRVSLYFGYTPYYGPDGETVIKRPSEIGFYTVRYSFESEHYKGELTVPFQIRQRAINTVYTYVEDGIGGHIVAPESVVEGDVLHVEFVPDTGIFTADNSGVEGVVLVIALALIAIVGGYLQRRE